jgi:CO dehydrogenase maturation factor
MYNCIIRRALPMDRKTTILALTGKGGVGETSLSAAMIRLLVEEKPEARILAIDADPAVGLATALGVQVTETLDDIRLRVAKDVTEGLSETQDILAEARFRIFEAMEEKNGFAFLAIGRPEAAGCY